MPQVQELKQIMELCRNRDRFVSLTESAKVFYSSRSESDYNYL